MYRIVVALTLSLAALLLVGCGSTDSESDGAEGESAQWSDGPAAVQDATEHATPAPAAIHDAPASGASYAPAPRPTSVPAPWSASQVASLPAPRSSAPAASAPTPAAATARPSASASSQAASAAPQSTPAPSASVAAQSASSQSSATSVSALPAGAPPSSQPLHPRDPDQRRPRPVAPQYPPAVFRGHGANPFVDPYYDPLSTFSLDGDTASWHTYAAWLVNEELLPADGIRTEDWVNAVSQDLAPRGEEALSIRLESMPAPFAPPGYHLLRIGIAPNAPDTPREPVDVIFILDRSGSMDLENRFPLAVELIKLVSAELDEGDRVGIVTYANGVHIALAPNKYRGYKDVVRALARMSPDGGTFAEGGIRKGYEIADRRRTTRLVLISDGLGNIGETGPEGILRTIDERALRRHTLTAIGVGSELNYNDHLLETLANRGNGTYHYVNDADQLTTLVDLHIDGILRDAVRDARVQVEFNRDAVREYRLLGYENRAVNDEQFRDDRLDFGEPGFARAVTALYELRMLDEAANDATMATVRLRYRDVEAWDQVVELERSVPVSLLRLRIAPSDSLVRSAAAAEFAEIMRQSHWACAPSERGDGLAEVRALLHRVNGADDLLDALRTTERVLRYHGDNHPCDRA